MTVVRSCQCLLVVGVGHGVDGTVEGKIWNKKMRERERERELLKIFRLKLAFPETSKLTYAHSVS